MSSCETCFSISEASPFSRNPTSLQPLAEHAREEEALHEDPSVTIEELPRSHWSDDSSDEDDDDEKVPSNPRLFNSLGRLSQRSKTRLSWGSLFSKS